MQWSDMGGPGSSLGPQQTAETKDPRNDGTWVRFAHGAIYNSTGLGLRILDGAIWQHYQQVGGPNGSLGLPTSGVHTDKTGKQVASFQGGTLTYHPSTRSVTQS